MSEYPNEGFWNLHVGNMNSGSTSNAQFPGFSSQVPMTPEQQAFLQQQAFVEFQQNFQNQQQNPPRLPIPQQQSQSSNSLTQTESQPKRTRGKRPAKKSKDTEPDVLGVSFRWLPDEETLLAKCYVSVFEDKNVRKAQANDTFWYRVLNEFNSQEDAWEVLRNHSKWDTPLPAPVDLTEDENIPAINTDELFGPDARPHPPGKQRPGKKTKSDTSASTEESSSSSQFGEIMTQELRLKREAAEAAFEVAKEKDRTVMRLKEMEFLAISTKDLPEDDAYLIEEQKKAIRAKYKLYQK
ncbi:hypothetical protein Tco_0654491 [Tanacetum coccineum]|uniref:No apical meristem-associated C-terminal domain-containing protein n=1 Tax=Tanacetum coccineum TaxID=301880 RepID=A0ABQ4X3L9_9ASTR